MKNHEDEPMILRRLLQHTRETNWFLVIVDLLVVMLGLWGAFQLDNWKQHRQDAASEQFYLDQLHTELLTALTEQQQRLAENLDTLDSATQAALVLQQPAGGPELSPEQCRSLWLVSIRSGDPVVLTTMQELINGGNLSLLKDRELKTRLYQFQAQEESFRSYTEKLRSNQQSLPTFFPELLARSLDQDLRDVVVCDTEGMRPNRSLLNHVLANRGRFNGLVRGIKYEAELLAGLDKRLDYLLGLSH
ncbi:MAG: hypothetical protein MUP90_06200 [Gammaproteobacteria bacterium]|nr:hypothetical protein [Gammaproteobacteria bacterium]